VAGTVSRFGSPVAAGCVGPATSGCVVGEEFEGATAAGDAPLPQPVTRLNITTIAMNCIANFLCFMMPSRLENKRMKKPTWYNPSLYQYITYGSNCNFRNIFTKRM
jgi:hypothetical protein